MQVTWNGGHFAPANLERFGMGVHVLHLQAQKHFHGWSLCRKSALGGRHKFKRCRRVERAGRIDAVSYSIWDHSFRHRAGTTRGVERLALLNDVLVAGTYFALYSASRARLSCMRAPGRNRTTWPLSDPHIYQVCSAARLVADRAGHLRHELCPG